MKDEQINAAIAEACGWTECRLVTKVVLSTLRDPVAYGIPPNGTYEIACFNYASDLNAMHEAEKVLKLEQQYDYWSDVKAINGSGPDQLFTTARQRAEAFLRTLGKWEEAVVKESLTAQPTAEDSSVVQFTPSNVSGGMSLVQQLRDTAKIGDVRLMKDDPEKFEKLFKK
jgi:hypothetical protein